MRTVFMILLLVLSACSKGGGSTSGGPVPGTTEQTPRPTPPPTQVDGIYTVVGAPDPRACAVDADCIGDTIPAQDLCCQDPHSVVPHARAWRTWMTDWRTRSCAAAHTCPPPPNPARPAECGFAVSCKDSRCVNACPP
ncbi:MAG: hypothetical protein H0T42_12745 [Deltaproteobacteria bacterium]|nr:hypothetical protein [Deltaproteobacteria bacterium]